MKIDRLIGIVTVLLQKDKVTAPYLAERFEVSRRTIHRDIEELCMAGIPIVTLQGSNGGIAIAEGYKIDKTLFTPGELQAVLTGLSGLDSVAQGSRYRNIIGKFSGVPGQRPASRPVQIDLASHYKDTLAPKISAIQQSIETNTKLSFDYYSRSGKRRVVLSPCRVMFHWSDWYVLGYDEERAGFRLFKLNRLWALEDTGERFTPREVPEDKLDLDGYYKDNIQAVILVDKREAFRLIEEYGPNCYEPAGGGRVRFAFPFTDKEYLFQWLLGFGANAELIEPPALRKELKLRLENALKQYVE